jgi:Ca2+-binding RTX toxin-like protein
MFQFNDTPPSSGADRFDRGSDMARSRYQQGGMAELQRPLPFTATQAGGRVLNWLTEDDHDHDHAPDKTGTVPSAAATTIDTVPGSTASGAVLALGTMVTTVIDTPGDHDWYGVSLVAGQSYVFTTQAIPGSNPDSFLTLRNAAGTALASNDDGGDGTHSLFAFTATTTGLHFLDVGTFNDQSVGSMRVAAIAVPPVGADSVIASTATSATLAVGGALAGNIETSGDRDWYAITLAAGQSYMFRTGGVVADGTGDTILTLRNAAGTVLASNDDSGEAGYSALRFTATTGGTYYLDVSAFNTTTGQYTLSAATVAPLSVYSNDQIADQLTNGFWGGGSHRFDVAPGGTVTVNLTALTTAGQTLAREAFALWTDVTGIRFTEVSAGGQIRLDDNQTGAFANASYSNGIITSATINISTAWLGSYGTSLNSYSFQTYIHEIGHVLGLGHAGNYNGTASYGVDALYANDSWAATIMSYFDQNENTYFAGLGFTRQFLVTPMVADAVATTSLYGTNTLTRTGNTIYGFGNTSGRAIYDAASFPSVSYTVFDNGGIDTLNYSGFAQNQRIFLAAEVFSDVGGRVGNVSIARGAVIENATGGAGNDTIVGNAADNLLTGNGGNDAIDGAGGTDTAAYAGLRADFVITYVTSTRVTVSGPGAGLDTLDNIEFLQFTDSVVSTVVSNTPPTGATLNNAVVAENFATGFQFGSVTATDPDAGEVLRYSLVDDAGGRFAINIFTGILSIADATLLDFETATSHDITVRVTDLAGAAADFDFVITVTNANDLAPVFDPLVVAHGPFFRPENGTVIIPLTGIATDPDQLAQISYAVSGGADAALFTVDAVTRELRFLTAPDFEAPGDADGNGFYEVIVAASDGGLSTNLAITVIVTDAEEVPTNTFTGTSAVDSFAVADANSWLISGLAGNDTLTGGGLADIIIGGRNNDVMAGGGGNDIFKIAAGDGIDSFDGGAGIDRILATRDNTSIAISALTGIEIIDGGPWQNVRIIGTTAAETLDFSAIELLGITSIDAGSGNDTIIGSTWADTIALGLGNDIIRGGDGDDTFLARSSTGVDIIDGGAGEDMIVATMANFSLNVTALTSIEAIDAAGFAGVRLIGGNAADVLDFSSTLLIGIANINGSAGNDRIIGSLLADTIIGGVGLDVLTGGGGADSFVYETISQSGLGVTRADRITDFLSGTDRIDLSAIDADAVLAGNQAFVFIGTDAFTGLGQLRLGTDTNGNVALFGNTTGTLTADFQISFDNNAPLVVTDFVL